MAILAHAKPMAFYIEKAQKNATERIEKISKDCEENVKNIENVFQLLPLLDAAGLPLNLNDYSDVYRDLKINLGLRPEGHPRKMKEFVAKLQNIRKIADCPLKYEGKDIADARKHLVRVSLTIPKYPGLKVVYQVKVKPQKRAEKCRLVRKTYSYNVLVCDSE